MTDHAVEAKRQLSEEGNPLASIAHSLIALTEYLTVPRHLELDPPASWHEMTQEDIADAFRRAGPLKPGER